MGMEGAGIKEPYDPEVIFQLDRFHIYQEIKKETERERSAESSNRIV